MLPLALALLLQGGVSLDTSLILPGRGRPSFTAPRITVEPTIDGSLADTAWRTAIRLTGFSQFQPVDDRAAARQTEVRVMYSARALYFGIVAHTGSRAVNATVAKRDNIDNDDRVLIYLDTFNDRRRAFMFGANALGVQMDGVKSEAGVSSGNLFGGSTDFSPDYRFDSKGTINDSTYVVEIRIPFKSLRFPATGPQRWGINVSRFNATLNTEDTWTDAKRSASFLAQSGTMEGIENVDRGIVTEVQPFVTSAVSGERLSTTGAFDRSDPEWDAGANIRVGFPAISLDATINPDFSQVEADVGQVTVNERFALFIPEKRPFFLEGIELFSGSAINAPSGLTQLVYTRQVAQPIAGGKVTGKLGRLGIAHMTALDDTPGDDALFNIARLRTDLGGSSVAGLTFTDRRVASSSNTVVATDARIVFRQLYYFDAQLGGSRTTRGDATHTSPLFKAELDRTGRFYGFNYLFAGIGENFESDAGFVPRNDMIVAHGFNRIAFYGKDESSFVQSAFLFGGPVRVWRYRDFGDRSAEEGNEAFTSFLSLRGGWSANMNVDRRFFTLDPSLSAGLYQTTIEGDLVPYAPSGKMRGLWRGSFGVSTPVFKTFNVGVSTSYGATPIFVEGAEGREFRLSGSLGVRPSAGVRVEGSAVYSHITREIDSSPFARVVLPRVKMEIQPSRALFFRMVSEYRAERVSELREATARRPLVDQNGDAIPASRTRNLRTDWLVSYEPTPGTVAFLGYGNTMARASLSDSDGLRRETDGFFLKLAYQFRN